MQEDLKPTENKEIRPDQASSEDLLVPPRADLPHQPGRIPIKADQSMVVYNLEDAVLGCYRRIQKLDYDYIYKNVSGDHTISEIIDTVESLIASQQIKQTRMPVLTPRSELFCQYYTDLRETNLFGNGTLSYAKAYNLTTDDRKKYNTAAANASRMLRNANILARIRQLLDVNQLTDELVDKELALLVIQNVDWSTKLGAIKEYNSLKQRITKKVDLEHGPKTIEDILMNNQQDIN